MDDMKKQPDILIIDDEEIVLRSCRRILRKLPYAVDTVLSGEEGLQCVEKKDYDIVITDLKMPGIDGMKVLETIKEKKHEMTVIIFTGFATVESARRALKMGAFDYIPKPFTAPELREVIQNALQAREDSSQKMLDLMAIVSHELKSPLSAVRTTADTLYRGYFGKLEPEQQETLESILKNCQYLEDIIRNCIDLSKMELDDLASFKKEIDFIADVIQPVLSMPDHAENMKQMRIVTDFQVRPLIYGDPNLLEIVITNVINNAIKYGVPDTDIEVRLIEEADRYLLSVYNRGVGISKEDIDTRLFKRFSRLKQEGTEGVKGSGLGLYICKKIVEKHQGSMWAESQPGEWVTFYISLPKGETGLRS
jgi:two-component system sensor histidine kinase/response regulator